MSSQRLTICHLIQSLHTGGAEVLATRIVRRLQDTHRLFFVCLEDPGELGEQVRAEGFPVIALNKPPGVDLATAWRLRRLLQSERADLVHAHFWGSFFYAALARWPGHAPAVLFMDHGWVSAVPDFRKEYWANRFLFRRNDRAVGVSEPVYRSLIERRGFPPARTALIPNGIDLSAFHPDGPERAAVRAELNIGPDDLVLIQVARLDPIKNHPLAIRALELVRQRQPDARLVVVGDGPERNALAALARDRGLEQHVLMLGMRGDVSRLLQAADIVLLTSTSEGMPLSLIEGMATGLPVVATNVGGIPQVVRAGETGLLVPSDDAGALAERVLELATAPEHRAQLGQAGRARARAKFSEDHMVATYDRMYREMAAPAQSAPGRTFAGAR